jgi:hypothetical protein
LFLLDDHRSALAIAAGAGDDEIDAFGGLRDVEIDPHAGVVRDSSVLQYCIHVPERALPRIQFTGTNRFLQHLLERVVNDLLDPVG